jgi:anti-anti-sigma factor
MQFAVQTTQTERVAVAAVYGELDIATTPALSEAVRGLIEHRPQTVVLDLTPAEFLDSTACRYLLDLRRVSDEAGIQLSIVCPKEAWDAWRVLEMLGLLDPLGVMESPPPGVPTPEPPPDDGA